MRILQGVGRAIVKLALFALFAHLLARPYAVGVVSLITEPLPGPVEFVSGIMSFVSRLAFLFAGMALSYILTRKVGEHRPVQVVVGFASMAGMYWLAENIARLVGYVFGGLVQGILMVGAAIITGSALLIAILKLSDFGGILLLAALLKDDHNADD